MPYTYSLSDSCIGILLSATGIDALGQLFPLCYAVVDAENGRNWHWFLESLHSIIERTAPDFIDPTNIETRLTFLSDRQKGLLEGVASIFPESAHGYCIKHLERNFRKHFKDPILGNLLWKAAKATSKEEYDEAMANMDGINPNAPIWLQENAPPQHWAEIYFKGKRYGHYTSNIAESLNSWVLKERELPIMPMMEAIRYKMMQLFEERRHSEKDTDLIVSKVAKSIQLAKVNLARQCRYMASSETLYEVLSTCTNTQYIVDFEKWTCSCRKWQGLGYPCHHAIAVMIGRHWDPEQYVHQFFTVAAFRATYSGTIVCPEMIDITKPLDPNENRDIRRIQRGIAAHNRLGDDERDVLSVRDMIELEENSSENDTDVLLPPSTNRPPGSPKNNRMRSGAEHVGVRIQHCGRCGGEGHSKRTCTKPLI